MFKVPSLQLYLVSLSCSHFFCFWNVEGDCFFISVGKEKGNRRKSSLIPRENIKGQMGYFEQILVKLLTAERV